jgi:hypothetical protein
MVGRLVGRFDDEINFNSYGTRAKRGIFDFVGQTSKILFGTLDSSDADYYNKQIDLIYNNSQQLTNLYKKQISIMRSTINDFSDAFIANNGKFKEIDFNLHKLNEQLLNDNLEIDRNNDEHKNKFIPIRMCRNDVKIRIRFIYTYRCNPASAPRITPPKNTHTKRII